MPLHAAPPQRWYTATVRTPPIGRNQMQKGYSNRHRVTASKAQMKTADAQPTATHRGTRRNRVLAVLRKRSAPRKSDPTLGPDTSVALKSSHGPDRGAFATGKIQRKPDEGKLVGHLIQIC